LYGAQARPEPLQTSERLTPRGNTKNASLPHVIDLPEGGDVTCGVIAKGELHKTDATNLSLALTYWEPPEENDLFFIYTR